MKIHPIILCGGTGTRLWPLSRKSNPKQFLTLFNNRSLLQETVLRINNDQLFSPPMIVTNTEYKFLVKDHLNQIGIEGYSLILEPYSKNTAPATAISALHLTTIDPEAVMLVLSSDHYIAKCSAFTEAIQSAYSCALEGKIITFGMAPTCPHTGYGYIRVGELISREGNNKFEIKRFEEKPSVEKAKEYITSDEYCWNSGIFMMKAKVYLEELNKFRPDIYESCKNTLKNTMLGDKEIALDKGSFIACPADSIDYAIMERTTLGCVLKIDIGWNDIGSWDTVWDLSAKDEKNNVCMGDIIEKDCRNSYFYSENKNLVAAIGLQDVIIIQTRNATLALHKSFTQEVKNIVSQIEDNNREESIYGSKVPRPWGNYEVYADESHFKVKKIVITPGSKLSLQSHNHRAEHWIVVKGIATVTKGTKEFELQENESTFIRPKEIHRLENKQDSDLHIIEVQTGSYFGEDDIMRYDDIYGRTKNS